MRLHDRPADARERVLLDRQPERDAAMSIVIDCWHDLDSCRALTQVGAGPIPWTAIEQWARARRLDAQWLSLLSHVIAQMDAARWERISSERRTKETRDGARNSDQGRPRQLRPGR